MTRSMDRRTVFSRISAVLGGVLGAALTSPAVLFVLDPVRRWRRGAAARPPVPIARFDEVPDLDQGSKPLRAVVTAKEVRDAWTRHPSIRLGAVWVFRRGKDVTCLSTTCPHSGCAVDYDEKKGAFFCPCHDSTFALDGKRREGPSPRDMDRLDIEVQEGEVLCHYRRFRPAVGDKEPV